MRLRVSIRNRFPSPLVEGCGEGAELTRGFNPRIFHREGFRLAFGPSPEPSPSGRGNIFTIGHRHRKNDFYSRTCSCIFNPDSPAVRFDDPFRNCQSYAKSRCVSLRESVAGDSIEPFKHALAISPRNTSTLIFNRYLDDIINSSTRANGDLRMRR